jgi:ABC-type spermidine/putrescine transport system permease subunit II
VRGRRWRVVVLVLAALYFLVPLLSAAEFSLRTPGGRYGIGNYLALVQDEVLFTSLLTSLQIAVFTAVLVLVLVVPTAVWVRLRFPAVAGLPSALVRVVLPAIRSAVLGAAFLTLALVLGEIVIARILLYTDTFPIAVVEVGRSAAGVSVALSLASLVFTWLLLLAVSFAGGRRTRKASS